MVNFKWLVITLGMVTGVFSAWQYQIAALVALLMGYASCYSLKWPNFQLFLAYLYGGLATGFGLQILTANAVHHQFILMIIQPLLLWLVLRIFFYAVETQFTLHPNAALSEMRAEDAGETSTADVWQPPQREGTSAWSGDSSGRASIPDGHSAYIHYDFYCTGEIAMGGPTYGDVVFSNQCAFTGVGPSIALSEDGRYAAMTLPSRNQWGVLLVDLLEKKAYQPKESSGFWEIDHFNNGLVQGRFSPITSNVRREATIDELKAASEVQQLVQDDGWWILDYPEREPFPTYDVVTIKSSQGAHKVTFVPDLKPHEKNPFTRTQHPKYIVMVDDVLLGIEVNYPHATWVNGAPNSHVQDGRFLVLQQKVFDFNDALSGKFDVKHPTQFTIAPLDEMTNLSFGEYSDAGEGKLQVQAIVMPRSTSFSEAEYEFYSTTHPWDEEDVQFWDAQGGPHKASRRRIQTFMQYLIDFPQYCKTQSMRLCTEIHIVNRANPKHSAILNPIHDKNVGGQYGAYTLTSSCGITLQEVTHEAIWSHCGRYLALVYFAAPPLVPHQIVIVDFESASIKTLPASYALPSFIWFDETMLELSEVIGVNETITYGMGKESTHNAKRVTDEKYANHVYALLIESLPQRLKALEEIAEAEKTSKGWSGASVNKVSRHIILFAPDFNQPVLQPPDETQTS